MKRLFVIKIGGNIIDDELKLSDFLKEFAAIKENKILVHGGGKLATRLAGQLGIPQQLIEGRRITDQETLKIITMVYAGYINKNIVAQLQSHNCNALGICGADGNALQAHKRAKGDIDYGFAGDVDVVNTEFFTRLINMQCDLVVAPVTHDRNGQLLNTNADTIAQEIATSLSNAFEVHLVYGFENAGVVQNAENEDTVRPLVQRDYYGILKEEKIIFAGMIPKLDNAFAAVDKGVK